MIPMRDGVKLSTKIHFPDGNHDSYPVVLVRTPYNKEILTKKYVYLVENGYVVALQDVRGRFDSEGEFEPFVRESEDGYDAIEWLAGQSWCNGNIGMIGGSYNGWVQYCAAVEKPPHLKTIIPNVALADLFHDLPFNDGIFKPGIIWWCAIIENDTNVYNMANKWGWDRMLNHQPVSKLDSIVFSETLDYYQKWMQHENKDEYWKQGAHREVLGTIKIPVFLQSGWFDSQLRNSKLAYNELSRAGNENVKLIIGPWGHTDQESSYHAEEFMGEAADDINLQWQYLRWFDFWLKGQDNGIMKEPKVQLYARNSNKWYSDDRYPLSVTRDKKLFLKSLTKADFESERGIMTFEKDMRTNPFDSYRYDPGNVPLYSFEMFEKADFDQLRELLNGRNDYLSYRTDPFDTELTILGQISAKIYASSSAADTDWFAVLTVVNEENKIEELIGIGMLRAKFRNSFEKPELLEKGKVYSYDIDMSHNGLTISEGQRLELIITSSWGYPIYGKNMNTGNNSQIDTVYEIAEQKIYHTNEYPSFITIPVVDDLTNDTGL